MAADASQVRGDESAACKAGPEVRLLAKAARSLTGRHPAPSTLTAGFYLAAPKDLVFCGYLVQVPGTGSFLP